MICQCYTGLHNHGTTGQTAAVLGLPDNLVFLGRVQKNLMARGAAIFTYHKIGAPPQNCRDPFLYTKIAEFDRQLAALREIGFQPARLGEIIAPGNSQAGKFVVTFDDGFRNVLDHGLEILARHQIPAIQFIVSDFIGKQNKWDVAKGDSAEPLMDDAQIRQWLSAGHEIGSHSATHRNLKQLNATDAREEIVASKKTLEDKFGVEVRHFCYPFGGWTPQARHIVAGAGYQTASTVEFGVVDAKSDLFTLQRIIPLSRGDLTRKMIHRLARKAGL